MSESKEAVAFELLRAVMDGESKSLGNEGVDRKDILDAKALTLAVHDRALHIPARRPIRRASG